MKRMASSSCSFQQLCQESLAETRPFGKIFTSTRRAKYQIDTTLSQPVAGLRKIFSPRKTTLSMQTVDKWQDTSGDDSVDDVTNDMEWAVRPITYSMKLCGLYHMRYSTILQANNTDGRRLNADEYSLHLTLIRNARISALQV